MTTPNLLQSTKYILALLVITTFIACQEPEDILEDLAETAYEAPVAQETLPEQEHPEMINENPNRVVGPMDPITKIPYSQISSQTYTIELARWDIPNNRTQAEKTTDNIQAAIDWAVAEGYGIIRLPAGHYLIGKYGNSVYQAGIELHSNMAFLMDKNAILEMAPNDKWNYCAIAVTKKSHVVIAGGTIIGDKDEHTYTPRSSDGKTNHDEGHLICVQTLSEYVIVENMILEKATGDGVFLIAWGGDGSSVKHITIRNNNIGSNRRQGISVVGGSNLLIENNEIHHTKGANPGYGIDVESVNFTSRNVTMRSNYFHHNRGDILSFDCLDCIIENNVLEQGEGSTYLDAAILYWNKSNLTIRNNVITQISQSVNNWNAVVMNSYGHDKTNPATTYIYNNTCNNCGFYMYTGKNLMVRDNILNNGHLVFQDFTNLNVFNNTITHDTKSINWAFRLRQIKGNASGNTYNGETHHLDLKNDSYFSNY